MRELVVGVLHNAELSLETHAAARVEVVNSVVFMDQDGITGHGVVSIDALIEER